MSSEPSVSRRPEHAGPELWLAGVDEEGAIRVEPRGHADRQAQRSECITPKSIQTAQEAHLAGPAARSADRLQVPAFGVEVAELPAATIGLQWLRTANRRPAGHEL
jgi:hypothetical protein